MEDQNKKIFLAILSATFLVVALVWYATAPNSTNIAGESASSSAKIQTVEKTDVLLPVQKATHLDPRIAATVLTSGDEYDHLLSGAESLFVYVFTH